MVLKESQHPKTSRMSTSKQTSRILEVDNGVSLMYDSKLLIDDGTEVTGTSELQAHRNTTLDDPLGLRERAFSAVGAAFLSAILVNPLDVVKVLDTEHYVGRISISTAPDASYKEMANHCEALLMGNQQKMSYLVSTDPNQAFVSEYVVTEDDAGKGSLLEALSEAGFLIELENN